MIPLAIVGLRTKRTIHRAEYEEEFTQHKRNATNDKRTTTAVIPEIYGVLPPRWATSHYPHNYSTPSHVQDAFCIACVDIAVSQSAKMCTRSAELTDGIKRPRSSADDTDNERKNCVTLAKAMRGVRSSTAWISIGSAVNKVT